MKSFLNIGDFNTEISQNMKTFCDSYELKSLVKESTFFKNQERSSCIDLILTNSPCNFQNSCAVETGLSDFHKMIVTVMKATLEKLRPKMIYGIDYKFFSNNHFRNPVFN